jgi:hypothetical protein
MIEAGFCPFCNPQKYIDALRKLGYERWAIESSMADIREETEE